MKSKWEGFKLSCREEENWHKQCKEAHLDGGQKPVNTYIENCMAMEFGLCRDWSITNI